MIHQWVQPGPFPEQQTPRVRAAVEAFEGSFVAAVGHSSRDYGNLFAALQQASGVRCVVVGCKPDKVPPQLKDRVTAFEELRFEEYVWIVRRACTSVISLRHTEHTSGLRVWWQSIAMGTPVLITATPSIQEYINQWGLALPHMPGDSTELASQLATAWARSGVRRSGADFSLPTLPMELGPEAYDRAVHALVGSLQGRAQPT